MSKSLNQTVKYWEDLERKLRGTAFSSFASLSAADCNTIVRALIVTCMITEEDLLHDSSTTARRDLTQWIYFVLEYGVPQAAKDLKTISNSLLVLTNKERELSSVKSFKRSIPVESDVVGNLIAPVRAQLATFIKEGNPWSLRTIHQFLNCWSRVTLPSYNYEEQSLADYLRLERHLRDLVIPPSLLNFLKLIIGEWFQSYPMSPEFIGTHGPGAVATLGKSSRIRKYMDFGYDDQIHYAFRDLFPYRVDKTFSRTCDVIFVPKSLLTWRTISMEPSTLMFCQKGVQEHLYDWISQHSYLRKRIHLRDATHNRELAKAGSTAVDSSYRRLDQLKHYATIDLSSASDCVSWKLVKAIFSNTPIYRFLLTSRSREARLPDGRCIELQKYAPMGSALCFPIENIVFAAITEMVVRVYGKPSDSDYLVYGDDIVVSQSVVQPLMEALEQCGFFVNKTKSFTSQDQPFRESCGGEYYNGVDITPLRLPRNYAYFPQRALIHHPATYAGTIDLINRLLLHGYRNARSLLLKQYLVLPKSLRPIFTNISEEGDCAVISPNPVNHHLAYKPNYDCQAMDLIHGVIRTKCEPDVEPEDAHQSIYLFDWLSTTVDRDWVITPHRVPRGRHSGYLTTTSKTIS